MVSRHKCGGKRRVGRASSALISGTVGKQGLQFPKLNCHQLKRSGPWWPRLWRAATICIIRLNFAGEFYVLILFTLSRWFWGVRKKRLIVSTSTSAPFTGELPSVWQLKSMKVLLRNHKVQWKCTALASRQIILKVFEASAGVITWWVSEVERVQLKPLSAAPSSQGQSFTPDALPDATPKGGFVSPGGVKPATFSLAKQIVH